MKKGIRALFVVLALSLLAAGAWAADKESPILGDLVKKGALPSLANRLPKEPLVIKAGMMLPREDAPLAIGKYGGQLRFASPSPDGGAETGWCNTAPLLRNLPGVGQLTTEVAGWTLKSYTVDAAGKVFTFKMRDGLKWSDGQPCTTDDVKFWYEDFLLNKELTPVVPSWFSVNGVPGKLEIIDKLTFRVSFSQAYGSFLVRLGSYWFGHWSTMILPRHYMKNYHIKYTSLDKLKPLLKEASLEDNQWPMLFNKVLNFGPRGTIGLPSLNPWVLKERPSPGVSIFERNAYFWMVDEAGNQLPYVDTLRNEVVQDSSMVLLKAMSGEIDLIAEAAVGADVPLLKENEAKGGYRVGMLHSYAEISYFYNFDAPDKEWAKIVQNPKFRLALSTALNRKEIKRAVYNDMASIPAWAPAFDQAKANKLLDEVGLNKKDSEGWRLRPDGKRMEMNFEIMQISTDWVKLAELASAHWSAVGIKSSFKVLEGGFYGEKALANELYVTTSWGHSYQLAISEPLMIEMLLPYEARWPVNWTKWYTTGGKQGVKPTMPEALELYKYIDQLRVASTNKERADLITKTMNLWHEKELFLIPVEKAIDPWLVNANLGNTPISGSRHGANAASPIYYYKD
jgi:peptide/nickel transport system substrate-binding protein